MPPHLEAEKRVEAPARGIRLAGLRKLPARRDEPQELVLVALAEVVGQVVLAILRPRDPGLVDAEPAEVRLARLPDAVEMILMLVGEDREIEVPVAGGMEVLDDVPYRLPVVQKRL
jgi:hypothetical protein